MNPIQPFLQLECSEFFELLNQTFDNDFLSIILPESGIVTHVIGYDMGTEKTYIQYDINDNIYNYFIKFIDKDEYEITIDGITYINSCPIIYPSLTVYHTIIRNMIPFTTQLEKDVLIKNHISNNYYNIRRLFNIYNGIDEIRTFILYIKDYIEENLMVNIK